MGCSEKFCGGCLRREEGGGRGGEVCGKKCEKKMKGRGKEREEE